MKQTRLASEAVAELTDAADWYESQQSGLAQRFLQNFETVLRLIESRPSSFPRLLDTSPELNIRRALLPRFLRVGFPRVALGDSNSSLAHLKRRPRYWLNRVVR
jgi:hypothetical protein